MRISKQILHSENEKNFGGGEEQVGRFWREIIGRKEVYKFWKLIDIKDISIDPSLKKISVMHVIKLGFAPVSFPPG